MEPRYVQCLEAITGCPNIIVGGFYELLGISSEGLYIINKNEHNCNSILTYKVKWSEPKTAKEWAFEIDQESIKQPQIKELIGVILELKKELQEIKYILNQPLKINN